PNGLLQLVQTHCGHIGETGKGRKRKLILYSTFYNSHVVQIQMKKGILNRLHLGFPGRNSHYTCQDKKCYYPEDQETDNNCQHITQKPHKFVELVIQN